MRLESWEQLCRWQLAHMAGFARRCGDELVCHWQDACDSVVNMYMCRSDV